VDVIALWAEFSTFCISDFFNRIRQELTSTGDPTGIERQKRFGRFLSWGYLRPFACVMPMNWA
jgi:hypothetical protein